MAASRKSSRKGFWSAGITEGRGRSVQSQPNSPWKDDRVVGIQEHYNGHQAGLDGRKDEPLLEREGIVTSHSAFPEYLRPRIRKDLLPHDFMKWTSSGSASTSFETIHLSHLSEELPAPTDQHIYSLPDSSCAGLPVLASNDDASSYVKVNNGIDHDLFFSNGKLKEANGAGAGLIQGNGIPESLCLSDWIQQFEGSECEGAKRPSSLKEMEMQEGVSTVSTIDKDIYRNLVEMIPLMESFMEQRGNQRRSFAHHASLVYTPAPPRGSLPKKESPLKVKNKDQRATVTHCGARLDEQENVISWVEKENIQEACEDSYEDWSANPNTRELQNQIEELKQKLAEKDQILQAIQTYDDAHDAVTKTNEQLQNKIEELQQEVRQKEYLAQSAQLKLSEQQHEIQGLSIFLERLQGDVLTKNDRAFQMEEEMTELRCQVTALRYQLEAVDLNRGNTEGVDFDLNELWMSLSDDSPASNSSTLLKLSMQGDIKQDVEKLLEEFSGMESARRMYLAAVVAAREKPGEEALILAAELRKQLQGFLIQAPLSSKNGCHSLTSQTLGIQLM